jgi:hypothetical protein
VFLHLPSSELVLFLLNELISIISEHGEAGQRQGDFKDNFIMVHPLYIIDHTCQIWQVFRPSYYSLAGVVET